tara:strand:+ start:3907 stop:4356 length:450 start_codon:yes stop_codon:yes gene_type:complete
MFFKNHVLLISFFIFITSCQLKDPLKPHGIMYLENRSNELHVKKSNKNDVIKIFGRPHIKDKDKYETWIYFERILTKGKFHKLGQHVLKENNVLVLDFDRYGVLLTKDLIDKEEMNKLKFSNLTTENIMTKKSFVQKFLQSVRQKMYRK